MGIATESSRLETDFIQRQPGEGILRNPLGQRVIFVTDDFLTALARSLEERFGDRSGAILYQCGEAWGRATLEGFAARVESEYQTEIENLNMADMLEAWWKPLRLAGWGTWDHDFSHARQGIVLIDVFDSPMVRDGVQCGCFLYAGLFAQLFSMLSKRELAGAELQCRSQGADSCRFLVSTKKRIESAQYWRNEGASCEDIVNRLSST